MSIARALLGFGLAGALLLGCEQFAQEEDGGGQTEDGAPEDLALQLSVKQTGECRELRDQVLAARSAGKPSDKAEKKFLAACVEEVEPRSDGKPVLIPRDLALDDRSRCGWIVTQIDGGRDELSVKFRYYCPDDCDTLALADSSRHDKYCRDPRPDCAELARRLARMDSNSTEFARLLRYIGETCRPDTVRPPVIDTLTPCDSLRAYLARVDLTVEGARKARRQLDSLCGPRLDPADCDSLRAILIFANPTPAEGRRLRLLIDSLCGPGGIYPTDCDSLRMLLSYRWLSPEEHARILGLIASRCGPDTLIVDTLDVCDSLRLGLLRIDTATARGDSLLAALKRRCGTVTPPITPCDSLRRWLASRTMLPEEAQAIQRRLRELCGPDTDSVTCLPPVTPVRTLCDSLKEAWLSLEPGHPAYDGAKARYHRTCVDTLPPVRPPICADLERKLATLDPASREFARVQDLYFDTCAVIIID